MQVVDYFLVTGAESPLRLFTQRPPLGVAFGPSMVEEAGDFVAPQLDLSLGSVPEGMCKWLFC